MKLFNFFSKKPKDKKYSFVECKYDDYFTYLVESLKGFKSQQDASRFLYDESHKGRLEQVSEFREYRYGELYILKAGWNIVKSHEIVNKLNLSIFPKLIDCFISEENGLYIVRKIPNNKGKNYKQCSTYWDEVSEYGKMKALFETQLLDKIGYTIRLTDYIRVLDDGKIMIPSFDVLSKEDPMSKSEAIDRYTSFCEWLQDFYKE